MSIIQIAPGTKPADGTLPDTGLGPHLGKIQSADVKPSKSKPGAFVLHILATATDGGFGKLYYPLPNGGTSDAFFAEKLAGLRVAAGDDPQAVQANPSFDPATLVGRSIAWLTEEQKKKADGDDDDDNVGATVRLQHRHLFPETYRRLVSAAQPTPPSAQPSAPQQQPTPPSAPQQAQQQWAPQPQQQWAPPQQQQQQQQQQWAPPQPQPQPQPPQPQQQPAWQPPQFG